MKLTKLIQFECTNSNKVNWVQLLQSFAVCNKTRTVTSCAEISRQIYRRLTPVRSVNKKQERSVDLLPEDQGFWEEQSKPQASWTKTLRQHQLCLAAHESNRKQWTQVGRRSLIPGADFQTLNQLSDFFSKSLLNLYQLLIVRPIDILGIVLMYQGT